jgi:hypothetical protein
VTLTLSFWILAVVAALAGIAALMEAKKGRRGKKGKKPLRTWVLFACAALFILAVVVAAVTGLKSINPPVRDLGGMDLSAWCHSQNRGAAAAPANQYGHDAIDQWQCEDGHRITRQDMLAACRMLYGGVAALVECSNADDANSCRCYT